MPHAPPAARVLASAASLALLPAPGGSDACIGCHEKQHPGIVADWKISKHSASGVDCSACHGEAHQSATDAAKAAIPTPDTCAACHDTQVAQFKKGKHSLAWAAMKAMPSAHAQPVAMMAGMKGCGGCHKIGLKSEAEHKELQQQGRGFGIASCDACHTRHAFSLKEARQPQACQTCHMQEGNHEVRAPWGFLAVRLPLPEDPTWAADQTTILQALGVLDPDGKPTARLDVVKAADVARLDQESWQKGRDQMLKTCSGCHSATFAKEQLQA